MTSGARVWAEEGCPMPPKIIKETRIMEWIDNVLRDVAELPDRNSPADWPEAMLVTGEELRQIIVAHAPSHLDHQTPIRFFCQSEEVGFNTFESLAEAVECAESMLADARDNARAEGEWREEETVIRYGAVIGEAVEVKNDEGSYDYFISKPCYVQKERE